MYNTLSIITKYTLFWTAGDRRPSDHCGPHCEFLPHKVPERFSTRHSLCDTFGFRKLLNVMRWETRALPLQGEYDHCSSAIAAHALTPRLQQLLPPRKWAALHAFSTSSLTSLNGFSPVSLSVREPSSDDTDDGGQDHCCLHPRLLYFSVVLFCKFFWNLLVLPYMPLYSALSGVTPVWILSSVFYTLHPPAALCCCVFGPVCCHSCVDPLICLIHIASATASANCIRSCLLSLICLWDCLCNNQTHGEVQWTQQGSCEFQHLNHLKTLLSSTWEDWMRSGESLVKSVYIIYIYIYIYIVVYLHFPPFFSCPAASNGYQAMSSFEQRSGETLLSYVVVYSHFFPPFPL